MQRGCILPQMDERVVKSYDIRGVYPGQLDERFAYLLGRALPRVLAVKQAVLGYDARLSSPALYAALAAGLAAEGVRVEGLGQCPTELVYYAAGADHGYDLGVVVTASHNPPEYNGFKVVKGGGEPVTADTGLGAAFDLMCEMTDDVPEKLPGVQTSHVSLADYVDFALARVGAPSVKGLRVVVDAGNGVGGMLWGPLAERLGMTTVGLNLEPDGRFPAHAPDPTKRENLEPLIRRVMAERAGLGFCYDGDADRVVAVLADGHVVDGSEMIVCLAESFFGGDAPEDGLFGVAQSTCRKALDYLGERRLEPVWTPVGHAKIKRVMRAEPQMVFAGEDAGHYYYREFFCCDSALLTTLRMLHLAAEGRLEALIGSLPGPWFRPRTEPSFGFEDQAHATAVCRQVALSALDEQADALEVTCESAGRVLRRCSRAQIDAAEGVRADYADWWFCVRPSGTEPIARLSVEARSEVLLADRVEWLSGLFLRLKGN